MTLAQKRKIMKDFFDGCCVDYLACQHQVRFYQIEARNQGVLQRQIQTEAPARDPGQEINSRKAGGGMDSLVIIASFLPFVLIIEGIFAPIRLIILSIRWPTKESPAYEVPRADYTVSGGHTHYDGDKAYAFNCKTRKWEAQ